MLIRKYGAFNIEITGVGTTLGLQIGSPSQSPTNVPELLLKQNASNFPITDTNLYCQLNLRHLFVVK